MLTIILIWLIFEVLTNLKLVYEAIISAFRLNNSSFLNLCLFINRFPSLILSCWFQNWTSRWLNNYRFSTWLYLVWGNQLIINFGWCQASSRFRAISKKLFLLNRIEKDFRRYNSILLWLRTEMLFVSFKIAIEKYLDWLYFMSPQGMILFFVIISL